MSEKPDVSGLPLTIGRGRLGQSRKYKHMKSYIVGLCLTALGAGGFTLAAASPMAAPSQLPIRVTSTSLCPQAEVVSPVKHYAIWKALMKESVSDGCKEDVIEWLSGSVKISTEVYDEMDPVGEDPRWDVFGTFQDYLFEAFPAVHSTLTLDKVNTWGLVYRWQGSDEDLKPILLAAHQDVVPVNDDTLGEWEYPPYSGHYDGKNIWGRGSSDDKAPLIGILAAVENLISTGFEPSRGVVIASGFDEEVSGIRGAATISEYLLSTYGENGFAFIVDEGAGIQDLFGSTIAFPGVTEKGYLDIQISVASPGGHSSMPPEHTSIGLLASMIVELEANPITPKLSRDDVFYDTLLCAAVHSTNIDETLKDAILASTVSDVALSAVESVIFQDRFISSLVGTTRAVDLVGGGIKANALPEDAWTIVNHRIATKSSVSEVIDIETKLVETVTERFNLSLTSFGEIITDPSVAYYGSVELFTPRNYTLEPAPVSPYKNSAVFDLFSGTIKTAYNVHRGLEGDNINVYPGYMTGNTDTRHYWKLSENIYRYTHGANIGSGIHTVNEHIPVDSVLEIIEFYTTLILNADEAIDI